MYSDGSSFATSGGSAAATAAAAAAAVAAAGSGSSTGKAAVTIQGKESYPAIPNVAQPLQPQQQQQQQQPNVGLSKPSRSGNAAPAAPAAAGAAIGVRPNESDVVEQASRQLETWQQQQQEKRPNQQQQQQQAKQQQEAGRKQQLQGAGSGSRPKDESAAAAAAAEAAAAAYGAAEQGISAEVLQHVINKADLTLKEVISDTSSGKVRYLSNIGRERCSQAAVLPRYLQICCVAPADAAGVICVCCPFLHFHRGSWCGLDCQGLACFLAGPFAVQVLLLLLTLSNVRFAAAGMVST
jgi:hypothetical protein